MSTREIITLQIGHYSNHVGTHWWNLQESSFVYDPSILATHLKEVNHDVLFREGRNLRGEVTYTPRLVAIDLYNSLGSLKREGSLYDVPTEDNIRWLGDVTLHQTEPSKKNPFLEDLEQREEEEYGSDENAVDDESWKRATDKDTGSSRSEDIVDDAGCTKHEEKVFGPKYYDLDDNIKVWSDFLRTGLHPKSLHLFSEHHHNNPEQPFGVFGVGQQCMATGAQRDEVENRLRYFVEECDQLQGFHVLFDNHNAFGGVSATMLSYLADEFASKSRFTFALTPSRPPDQTAKDRSTRIINSALSLHLCGEPSSLYIPLSLASSLWRNVGAPREFPMLQYKESLDYHTSAILAASLDTVSMPYRRETQSARVSDITGTFSSLGRKVAALNSSLPYLLPAETSFPDSLMNLGTSDPWTSLTPHVHCSASPLFHSCVVRGVPQSMAKRRKVESGGHLLSSCQNIEEVLKLYLTETYPSSHNAGCVMRDPVSTGSPFPHIFAPNVSKLGFIINSERPPLYGVDQVPMLTSLQSSTDLYSYVDSLVGTVGGFNISKHPHFLEAGLEPDDFSNMVHYLRTLAQCYTLDR